MAELYHAPVPRCPTHGQMHFDLPGDVWICHGWDGEGCPHTVGAGQIEWTHLGTADDIQFGLGDDDGLPGLAYFPGEIP